MSCEELLDQALAMQALVQQYADIASKPRIWIWEKKSTASCSRAYPRRWDGPEEAVRI